MIVWLKSGLIAPVATKCLVHLTVFVCLRPLILLLWRFKHPHETLSAATSADFGDFVINLVTPSWSARFVYQHKDLRGQIESTRIRSMEDVILTHA